MVQRCTWIVAVLLLLVMPWPAAAQTNRRWLADPALIVPVKTIGPNGGQQTKAGIGEIELLDDQTGWATYSFGLLRFDGRWWRPHLSLSSYESAITTAMRSATDGWIGGTRFVSGGPTAVVLWRYDGDMQLIEQQILDRNGAPATFTGNISDIALNVDGSAWAIGTQVTPQNTWGRPLFLFYDGGAWRDRTPENMNLGQLARISVTSTNEAFATGLLGQPGGSGNNAVRPAILHYTNGQWSEMPLPALPITSQPFSMRSITMRDTGEGWAIFYDAGTRCPNTEVLHYTDGAWTTIPREAYGNQPILSLGIIPGTSRGWATQSGCSGRGLSQPDRRLRFDNGTFTLDPAGAQMAPTTYGLLSDDVQWAAAGGSMLRYSDERLPTDRLEPGVVADTPYFPETGHYLGDSFRDYYLGHGLDLGDRGISERESLALFGYPVSEEFQEINPDTGEVLGVQYFERARMEYHRNNPEPYKILLGRLGFTTALRRVPSDLGGPAPSDPPAAGCDRFPETSRDLCPPLKDFWYKQGGLSVYGYPLTQARDEQSRTDGQTYLTQWFERERLEYHPEYAGTPYEVLLGLLGSEELRVRGYLPNN